MKYEKATQDIVFGLGKPMDPVSIPSAEVREKNALPDAYQYATLASDVQSRYHKGILAMATEFVRDWPDITRNGKWGFLTGTSGAGKTYAAAAIANELQRVYGSGRTLRIEWFPVAWRLPMLFDHHHFRSQAAYRDLYKRIHECDLLVVDDLLHAADYARSKEFLFGLFDYRAQHNRSMIVTANAEITKTDWSPVEEAFNIPFTRRLRDRAAGYTVAV